MKFTRRRFLGLVSAAVAVGACGTNNNGIDDASHDALGDSQLPPRDGMDALPIDAPGSDGGIDAGFDAALDTSPTDAGVDALDDVPAPDDAASTCPSNDGGTPTAHPEFGFGSIPLNSAGFPQGVMAGDALTTKAMVWTRYTGTRNLVLRVIETNRNGGTILGLAFEGAVTASAGNPVVRFDVTGLRPNAFYKYSFIERSGGNNVGRSRIGRFRTPIDPTDNCTVLTFGGVSCNSGRQAAMMGNAVPALMQAANDSLDFFIHAGDHIYADFYNNGAGARTLADYRNVYNNYWQFSGLQDVHGSTALYETWDDHEVYNNWTIQNVENTDRMAQFDAAKQAFFEYRAFRRNMNNPDRIWRSFKWGRVLEMFILDVRSERRPARDQYISPTQMNWLKNALSNSQAVFKCIVTSKPITGRVALANEADRADFWEAFRTQREELLQHIVNTPVRGVIFLSGDIHTGVLSRLEATGPYRNLHEVCMGPACSGDQSGAVDCTPSGQNDITIHRYNYTRFRADPTDRTFKIDFIGEGGGVICTKTLTL